MEPDAGHDQFKIFSGLLKASRSPDGKMRLRGIASSTTRDLHGDVMQATAIEDMVKAANNNLTIFLNHSYDVPEDVAGSVERASSKVRSVDQDGNPNIDLDLDIVINDTNPRAVKTFEAIEKGTKLGLSIGAFVPEGGATRQKNGSWVIDHVDLKETSIVSIPANPRSWIEYAVKSLHRPESVINGFGSGNQNFIVGMTEPTTSNSFTLTDLTITDAATCPDCGGSRDNPRDGCKNGFHNQKDAEPELVESTAPEPGSDPDPIEAAADDLDITDATVTVETPFANVTVDTGNRGKATDAGDSSQEGDDTEPEAEEGGLLDETADGDDETLGDDVTRAIPDLQLTGLTEAVALVRDLTRKLVESEAANTTLQAALSTLEAEKQAAFTERDTVLRETKAILDRVANAPLVRKSVIRDANADFRAKFGGVYSDSILKLLETHND